MDADRFDTLARLIGSRTTRRAAVALATVGLLGIAVPVAAAVKCSKQLPCPECYRCRRRRCRKKADDDPCGGGTCQDGVCIPTSACSPACTGGRECQDNGTCTCPADKPHGLPEQYCPSHGNCVECCIDAHCHPTQRCSIVEGHTCICIGSTHTECADGVCRQCCTVDDCYEKQGYNGGNVICTAEGNPQGAGVCRCGAGTSQCGGTAKFCTNLQTDSNNCGICNNVCRNETTCVAGECGIA